MHKYFRYEYTSITMLIITKAEIEYAGCKREIKALWDTGANITILNNELVKKLNPQPTGDGYLATISDEAVPSQKYKINLFLPGNIEFPNIEVINGETKGCDVLIGMDIISQGDFIISNYNGKTSFIFHLPSIGKFIYEPPKIDKVGRNEPCPCGSGKKYKHCCGRNI